MISFVALALAGSLNAATPCESLKSLSLPGTTITVAELVPAGPYAPPQAGARGAVPTAPVIVLPAHCRVAVVLAPSRDSHIEMEVWLPAENWNGKFQAVGNGGWAGAISFEVQRRSSGTPANDAVGQTMVNALKEGYATASTDTGHRASETPGASFVSGHPDKLIDFAYRAVHEMTVTSKAIVAAFYGRGPRLSYWNGCSTGGRQGLLEAQRYPDDFDGILAGAPVNNWVGSAAQFMWIAQAAHIDEASYIPPSKYALVGAAVLQACDALDGVKDGILEDPTRCKFDPKALECKGADGPSCLTSAQVGLARAIYAPSVNPRTKGVIYPGLLPGTELNWADQAGPDASTISRDHWRYVVFNNPDWDYKTLNFDSDIALAEKMDKGLIGATDPNLKAFFARGGKLLHYHGWADSQISPLNSIDYYSSVVHALGGKIQDSYRLFLAPGVEHCGGGPGPSQFNAMGALERWRESNVAPDLLIASHVTNNRVDMTRPLCPYPQIAHYKGVGSTNDAVNFVCKSP
jgi:feruloyl esterase